MANWKEYTTKSTVEDKDEIMIADAAANANKRTPFSTLWNWIAGKLASAVIAQLETTNKSIIPAINELNSNGLYNINPGEKRNEFFVYRAANRTANLKKITIQANRPHADITAIILNRKGIYFLKAECSENTKFTSCILVNAFDNQDNSLQGKNQDGKIEIPLIAWENASIIIKCNGVASYVTLSVE